MSTHAEIVAELTSRWPEHKLVPTLGRIEALCDLLGQPHRSAPVIQVAGTNGKGTTCRMIESLLRAMNLRVGRFASPHLQDIGERICIDGEPLSPERFDELYAQVKPLADIVDDQNIDGVKLTFFEFMTAMAFAAFADSPVDVMVLEVGMGGSWDSTNIADADVAVVCPVDLDHMHILGDTIDQIAAEKAGIIKPGCTAVLAGQQPEATTVLMERAAEVGATVAREGVEFGVLDRRPAVGGQVLRLTTADGPMGDIHLPLFGGHMAQNAALAVAATEAFLGGRALPADALADGFATMTAPGRLEVVRNDPVVILDSGHNPHGVRATLRAMEESFALQPLVGVYSAMRDKDVDAVLRELEPLLDHVVCTRVANFDRAMPADEVAEIATGIFGAGRVSVEERMPDAIEAAVTRADIEGGGAGGVLVCGSVIAAGEARTLLVREEDA